MLLLWWWWCCASYYTEVSSNAHAMWAMACSDQPDTLMPVRHLPAFVSKRWTDVPVVAVGMHTLVVLVVVMLPVGFDTIVQVNHTGIHSFIPRPTSFAIDHSLPLSFVLLCV